MCKIKMHILLLGILMYLSAYSTIANEQCMTNDANFICMTIDDLDFSSRSDFAFEYSNLRRNSSELFLFSPELCAFYFSNGNDIEKVYVESNSFDLNSIKNSCDVTVSNIVNNKFLLVFQSKCLSEEESPRTFVLQVKIINRNIFCVENSINGPLLFCQKIHEGLLEKARFLENEVALLSYKNGNFDDLQYTITKVLCGKTLSFVVDADSCAVASNDGHYYYYLNSGSVFRGSSTDNNIVEFNDVYDRQYIQTEILGVSDESECLLLATDISGKNDLICCDLKKKNAPKRIKGDYFYYGPLGKDSHVILDLNKLTYDVYDKSLSLVFRKRIGSKPLLGLLYSPQNNLGDSGSIMQNDQARSLQMTD